jgi:cytoskeletal protein RodZ
MNLNKGIPRAVIFLAASIIFLSSATIANNVFAQTEGEEEESTSMSTSTSSNYENFQNCLSDASGQYTAPTGDQIVNCFVASGYVQGSSSTSNAADTEDESEKTQANVVGDESEDGQTEGQTENVQVKVVDDKDNHDDHDDDHDEDDDHDDQDEDEDEE